MEIRETSTFQQDMSFDQMGKLLAASPTEQREWVRNMVMQNNTSILEYLEKSMATLFKEINAAKENLISEEEIEALFDSITEEEAVRNIAASNASINEDDREWARQILRKQGAL